jgi:hypothetical protein
VAFTQISFCATGEPPHGSKQSVNLSIAVERYAGYLGDELGVTARESAIAGLCRPALSLGVQGFDDGLRVFGSHAQKSQCWAIWSPPLLFPIAEGRHADADHECELCLGRA